MCDVTMDKFQEAMDDYNSTHQVKVKREKWIPLKRFEPNLQTSKKWKNKTFWATYGLPIITVVCVSNEIFVKNNFFQKCCQG